MTKKIRILVRNEQARARNFLVYLVSFHLESKEIVISIYSMSAIKRNTVSHSQRSETDLNNFWI